MEQAAVRPRPATTDRTPAAPSWRRPTRGAVAGVLVVVFGLVIGSQPLFDNSFLTHLTTGRLILDGNLPRHDPYTFTAHGEPWVIQSWLASVLYAGADRIAGGAGIRALVGMVTAALSLTIWRLSRPARTIGGRLVAVASTLVIGAVVWGSRPLIFGVLLFALTLLVIEERRDPRWLVPIFWVWVNVHGSFPLGLVLIAVSMVGRRLDGEEWKADGRAFAWAAGGTLLGAVNPLGPVLLLFPIELLQRQQVLAMMIEWQAPEFNTTWQRIFLLAATGTLVLLPRLPSGVRYRSSLLFGVFLASALVGQRNIVVASVVMVVVLAREVRGLGSIRSGMRSTSHLAAVVVLAVLGTATFAARLAYAADYDLSSYPVASLDRLQSQGLLTPEHRLAARDFVGNYLEWRTEGRLPVFLDDRVDMFPDQVIADERTVMGGGADWRQVLDRYQIETVVWEKGQALTSLLSESPDWERVHTDGKWITFRRRGA